MRVRRFRRDAVDFRIICEVLHENPDARQLTSPNVDATRVSDCKWRAQMRRTLNIAAVTLVTLAALAVWAIASIRSEAALNTPSPMAIAVQSDPIDLIMKTAGNLPSEQFDPF